MKKGYLEIGLLFLFVCCKFQISMTRHSHSHRPVNLDDCHRCAPGYGVIRHCNRHRDTECSACAPGHYSSHHSARRPCYPCSRCGIGLYVAHICTSSRDTVCDSCHTFKGPHNENFYERCVKPLLLQDGSNNTHELTAPLTKENVDTSRGVPTAIAIFSGIVIVALSLVFVVTCCFLSSRQKRVDHRYEAVATQDAVML